MPGLITRIIDLDNGPGTDYLHMSLWWAAYCDVPGNGDFVGQDTVSKAIVRCTGGTKLPAYQFNDVQASSDATRYPWIYADPVYRWSSGPTYGPRASGNIVRIGMNLWFIIRNYAPYLRFSGLQIESEFSAGTGYGILLESSSGRSIVEDTCVTGRSIGATPTFIGLRVVGDGTTPVYVVNNLFCDIKTTGGGYGMWHQDAMNAAIYNNTIANVNVGYAHNRTEWAYLKNNLCLGFTSDDWVVVEKAGSTNNSYYGVDPGANGIDFAAETVYTIFTDPDNANYSLIASCAAMDVGASLAADGVYPLAVDAFGTVRPKGGGYDLGFYEVPVVMVTASGTGIGTAPGASGSARGRGRWDGSGTGIGAAPTGSGAALGDALWAGSGTGIGTAPTALGYGAQSLSQAIGPAPIGLGTGLRWNPQRQRLTIPRRRLIYPIPRPPIGTLNARRSDKVIRERKNG